VEIGWAGVELTKAGLVDPLWAGFSKHFVTFHWHGDSFDIPTGAEVLARSERYIQAFRLGSHAYGVQFHPDEKEHRDLAFRFGDNIARWLNSQPR
jgi:GMP synthase (glutamine-hydrolysing)